MNTTQGKRIQKKADRVKGEDSKGSADPVDRCHLTEQNWVAGQPFTLSCIGGRRKKG